MLSSKTKLLRCTTKLYNNHCSIFTNRKLLKQLSPAETENLSVQVDGQKEMMSVGKLLGALDPKLEEPPRFMTWTSDTFAWSTLKKNHRIKMRKLEIEEQLFMPERNAVLGNELAAAHFILFRGGSVKFVGHENWLKRKSNEEVVSDLPGSYSPFYFVERIDVTDVKLHYEGLKNFDRLKRLQWLSFKNNPVFDDWCLDRICTNHSKNLQYLDISDCHKVSYRGLSALYKLERLDTLVVDNIADSHEFQLSCLMLEDINPHIKILGVDYVKLEEQAK